MSSKNIYIIIGLFLALVFLYYVSFRKGKISPPKKVKDFSNDGMSVNSDRLSMITDDLFNDIEGISITGHDNQLYKDANNLSDSELVYIINDWDNRYFAKNKETLAQALSKEFSWMWSEESAIMQLFYQRILKLNKNR